MLFTGAGEGWAVAVPFPSCPKALFPHVNGVPGPAANEGATAIAHVITIASAPMIATLFRFTRTPSSFTSTDPPSFGPLAGWSSGHPAALSTITSSKFAVHVLAAVSPIWIRPTGVVPVFAAHAFTIREPLR